VLFTPDGLRYAALITAFLVLLGGTAFAAVEQGQELSAWDGLYWAITTVTTVGYGDIQQTTDGGRIIAIGVMIAGIGFVAILTGAAAERFLAGSREAREAELRTADELAAIRERLERLER
jgi:voltage-gated potassium channel